MYKYIPQAGDTTIDELEGKNEELKEKITRRNKQIKALKEKIKSYEQKVKDILDITNNTDITNIIT